ncbi:MAG TPA: hypothetical protein DDW52_00490 [Planctomycetaceae bacterium]|nr:hypothetical protein [Planctomycetaceae bacterium]
MPKITYSRIRDANPGRVRTASKRRRGGAVVELAVCLPLLAILTLGSIEGTGKIFLRQAAVQAAYECAKELADRNGEMPSASLRAQEVLTARNITSGQVQFIPSDPALLLPGTQFTVRISVNGNERSVTRFISAFNDLTIEAEATMLKE